MTSEPTRTQLSDRRTHVDSLPRGTGRPRDHRLDFWRGLCLIDMVLVHLYYQNLQFGKALSTLIEFTRFAAGGFVFISGVAVGAIFLPRALDPGRRWNTYRSLWRRAGWLVWVQYMAAGGYVLLMMLEGSRKLPASPGTILLDILRFREGGDLLPFYALVIAFSPLLLELLRRRWGWIAVVAGSAALFFVGEHHPWAGAVAGEGAKFPPILWQAIFVAGLLAGAALPAYDRLGRRIKTAVAAFATSAAVWAFVMCYGPCFGLPYMRLGLEFSKVPLSAGEALRYLATIVAIAAVTDLCWPTIARSGPVVFVAALGRKSLPVYVAHVWVVEAVAWLCTTWWWMGRLQVAFAALSIALLWAMARGIEWWQTTERPPRTWTPAEVAGAVT